MPLSSCKVNENQCSEKHTLFEGINKILSLISTFVMIWIKFDRESVHKNVSSECEFCFNRRIENLTLLRGVNEITHMCVHCNVRLVLSLARNKIL